MMSLEKKSQNWVKHNIISMAQREQILEREQVKQHPFALFGIMWLGILLSFLGVVAFTEASWAVIPESDKCPDLASLADLVYSSGLGSFFWCLMVKPAYLSTQRPNGTFNGLFHEDGSVYSLEDYKAVSGKDDVTVRKELPSWFIEERKRK